MRVKIPPSEALRQEISKLMGEGLSGGIWSPPQAELFIISVRFTHPTLLPVRVAGKRRDSSAPTGLICLRRKGRMVFIHPDPAP
jgi:hypothetical protein